MTTSTDHDGELDHPPPARRALGSWRRWALGVAAVVLLAVAVHTEGTMLTDSIRSFAHLRWKALAFAVVFEIGSMLALALMERRLLILGGFELSFGRAVAIAYASNALSASLPVVGSGAATAYSYRRLVSEGAAPTMAGWAITLSGVISNVAFVLIISVGAIVSGNPAAVAAGCAGIVLTMVVAGVAVIALRRPLVRDRLIRTSAWTLGRVQRLIRRPAGEPAVIIAGMAAGLSGFRLASMEVKYVIGSAFRNWLFDLFCLVFSIKAAGVRVPWWGIVLAWAAGSGGASLNLTPGGLGVVEAALTGALVALGVPGRRALTAVLVYRAITFWLAIAIGWTTYWLLRRKHEPATAPQRAPPAGEDRRPKATPG
jgi:putative heme transporter